MYKLSTKFRILEYNFLLTKRNNDREIPRKIELHRALMMLCWANWSKQILQKPCHCHFRNRKDTSEFFIYIQKKQLT